MRIALAQVNAKVGDLAGNSDVIVREAAAAAARGAGLVVFPELALTGYPPLDLLVIVAVWRLGRGSVRRSRKPPAGEKGLDEPLFRL